jgi:hypothetical protein
VTFLRRVWGSHGRRLMTPSRNRFYFIHSPSNHHLRPTYTTPLRIKQTSLLDPNTANPRQNTQLQPPCLGESQQQCPYRPAECFQQWPGPASYRPFVPQHPHCPPQEGGSTTRKISQPFVRSAIGGTWWRRTRFIVADMPPISPLPIALHPRIETGS